MKTSRISRFCIALLLFVFVGSNAYAKQYCYHNMSEVLGCFLSHEDGAYKYETNPIDSKDYQDYTVKTYLLSSQKWPLEASKDVPTTIWQHQLVIYLPKRIDHNKAFLYVNGGRSRNIEGKEEFLSSREHIDYAKIAIFNRVPVIELQDVPNQYLFFDGAPFKEDQILAYTYKLVIENPWQNAYLAGHLPMAKAAIKAMNAAEEILKKEKGMVVDGFILSGASKRGWAVWLAAISDKRVEAYIPIVVDVLNVAKSITHVCKSYGGVCPQALRDYEKYNFVRQIGSAGFFDLMAIEDPYSYLKSGDAKYIEQLKRPKYIINASGDDFFVPDSSKWYLKDLPGDENYIRYLPNSMHYFKGDIASDTTESLSSINDSLNSFLYFILNKVGLPKVNWVYHDDSIEFTSSTKPELVKLWSCNNKKARDFRFITSYGRLRLQIKKVLYYLTGSMCDNCYKSKVIAVDCKVGGICAAKVLLPEFKKGWQAAFIELHYKIDSVDFVVTSQVEIRPDVLPEEDKGLSLQNRQRNN